MSKRALQLKTEGGGVVGFMLLASGGDGSDGGTCVIMVVPGVDAVEALTPWSQGKAGECSYAIAPDRSISITGDPGKLVLSYDGGGIFRTEVGGVTVVAVDGAMRDD